MSELKNFYDGYKNLVTGTVIEQEERRKAICEGCEFYSSFNVCKKCGCLLSAKIKAPNASCPEGKW